MRLGLSTQSIVESFSQAAESHFAAGTTAGSIVISNEIEFQYNKLMNLLPTDFLSLMDRVGGEVAQVTYDDKFSPYFTPLPNTLRAYIVYKGWFPCSDQSLESIGTCWESLGDYYSTQPANVTSISGNQYLINDVFDYKTQNLILYYDVDSSSISLPSLQSVLRSMVCANLGSRIFPVANSDQWSIVKYYKEDADKWLEYFKEGNYPLEYKKIKLLNKKTGFTSIRVVRG